MRRAALVAALVLAVLVPVVASGLEVRPGANGCAALATLPPGE